MNAAMSAKTAPICQLWRPVDGSLILPASRSLKVAIRLPSKNKPRKIARRFARLFPSGRRRRQRRARGADGVGSARHERQNHGHGKAAEVAAIASPACSYGDFAAERGHAKEAAEIAAVMVERGLGGNDPDLAYRLEGFRRDRSPRASEMRKLAIGWARLASAGRSAQEPREDMSIGPMLALAFPERIGKARDFLLEFLPIRAPRLWIKCDIAPLGDVVLTPSREPCAFYFRTSVSSA